MKYKVWQNDYFRPMRKALAKDEGLRKKFRAIFTRFGKKVNFKGYSEMTVLLTKIVEAETGNLVADHLWFGYTAGFEKAHLTEGVTVEFEARVKEYAKGYVNKRIGVNRQKVDYKLSHPTKITTIRNES
jgi:hypothetical protein